MTTKEKIVSLRRSDPYATLQSIGTECGVSREWARRVLKEAEEPTRHLVRVETPKCEECDSRYGYIRVDGFKCRKCGHITEIKK